MLLPVYAALKKIEDGINHDVIVYAMPVEEGLTVRAEIVCRKDHEQYHIEEVFTVQRMLHDEKHLDHFIERANAEIRRVYEAVLKS